MRIITILYIILALNATSQNMHDSILNGTTLINLKQANPNAFYKYLIADNCYTLIKFKDGKVIDYCFNSLSHSTLKVDTFYYTNKNGFTIKLNKKEKNPSNILRISKSKDVFYLCIGADDTLSENYYGNRFYYYSNKQLCSVIKANPTNKTTQTIKYTRKGLLDGIETRDSLDKYTEVTVYTKTGTIDFKLWRNYDITVREQYDGKGNLMQVDSTNTEYKHVGTRVSYYLNKNIKVKIGYSDGKQNGICYAYYEGGALKGTETYVLGKRVGKYVYYNKDGTIKKEGFYK